MSVDEKNLEEIFHEASEIGDSGERARYLEEACAGDQKLIADVKFLLESDNEAGDFMEVPAIDPGGFIKGAPLTEGPGSITGNYRLLEKIGEGGMAVVYMAQQQSPIQRHVALKLVKLGMDSEQVIARFEAERQALALMDHPHIARVFDAGTTESGRPYFVMELVKGMSITQFCDQKRLNTQDRLNLFVCVCQAVHHAHQRGIIHRDIKPSNVMVTLHDGHPVPKVIDFGIAKATNRRLTEKTLFTHYAQIIGTPEYMSPEQAELSDLVVDTRTDVYSLGVLLYELLTGKPPFEVEYLRSKGYAEIQRIIREEEPTKPSTKISTLGEALLDIADVRGTTPDALRRLMRADLDWIIMKAMEKDRTRRYDSARELSSDIERHLKHEPVLAGPPGLWYSTKKFLQRHRTLATTLLAVALALALGIAVSRSLFEIKASRDRQLSTVQGLYAKGRYQAALKGITNGPLSQSRDPKVQLLHAQLLYNVGRKSEAQSRLERLLDNPPQIAGAAHYLLFRIKQSTDATQAQAHREQADSLSPPTADGHALRALTAATPDEALRWLNQALALDPSHYASREARAFIYYGMRDYAGMHLDAESIIVLRPSDYLGYALRAIARRETGQLIAALSDHNRAITLCSITEELPRLYRQRLETHMRSGNYRAALDDARRYTDAEGSFPAFYALLGLGQYEKAQAEYMKVAKSGARAAMSFKAAVEAHTLELQNSGQDLVLPQDIAVKSPFYYLRQAAEFHQALREKGEILQISDTSWLGDWSPDGRQIAYARLGYGASRLPGFQRGMPSQIKTDSIEILDLETGKTGQITGFGNLPMWSPDGTHIAFVSGEEGKSHVWLVSSAGGEPRRLAMGFGPNWSRDSKRVFFRIDDGTICSIHLDLPNEDPVPVLAYPGRLLEAFSISPDGSLIAIDHHGEIHVLTFPEGREVTRWKLPWPCAAAANQLRWHPNGKTVVFNSRSYYNQLGICLFDIGEGTATHLLNGTRPWCRTIWSPDGSQVIVDPHYGGDVWLLGIDPNQSPAETLGPAYTTEELLAKLLRQWDQRILADPAHAENYVFRAVVLLATQDYNRAEQDLKHCALLINDPNDPGLHALSCWGQMYSSHRRYRETEMIALQTVQLSERFPEHFQALPSWYRHPYQQLIRLYVAQGDKQELVKLQRKRQQARTILPGSLHHDKNTGTYTITGSGTDIWNVWDEFRFAYKRLQGSGSIVAKIESIESADEWTKAGVMIRESLEPYSQNAAVLITPTCRGTFQHRKTALKESFSMKLDPNSIELPHWIRLERKGNAFSAQHSKDGVYWEDMCNANANKLSVPVNIDMSEDVYIGLAVTSHAGPEVTAEAKISNVRVTGTVTPGGPYTESNDIGYLPEPISSAEDTYP